MAIDIDLKISPKNIMEDFGDFESWSEGTSSAPDGWAMVGTAGSVARESGASNIKFGNYSMKIISGASASYAAEYSFKDYVSYAGRTITFGVWVKTSSASNVRIYIDDGVSARANSSYHTGGGDWEFLTVELQVDLDNTELVFGCEVESSTITAYFDGAIFVEGDIIFTSFRDSNVFIKENEFQPEVRVDVSEFSTPRTIGSVVSNVRLRSKEIRARVQIHHDSYEEARNVYSSIVKAITQGNQNAVVGAEKDLYLGNDRKLHVFLLGISKMTYYAKARVYIFNIDFLSPDPREKFISKLRDKQAISSSPSNFDFTYNGDIPSRPSFQFIAVGDAITNMTLENLTTGERFSFLNTITVGTTLFVDCEEGIVENDGIDDKGNHTGDLFMSLAVGQNYFKYTGSLCTILTDWWDRYL